MNIVYTTNDAFVPQVGACIVSVFENNKDVESICILLVSIQVSEENKERFRDLCDAYHRELIIIDFDDIHSHFDFSIDTGGWHPTVLARLVFDQILPADVDRVLYLDGDTIVRGSLKEFWEMDMKQSVFAGSIAPGKRKRIIRDFDFTDDEGYINAGVLLIDLKRWRQENTGKRILDFYKENQGKLFANDQDAINGALKGEIQIVSPRYNYYTSYIYYPYRALKKWQKPYRFMTEGVYNDAAKNSVIIHYLGEERPWRKGCRHPYQEDFDRYYAISPWKDIPKEGGWEFYYKCFYFFNAVVKPFPAIRLFVINTFAPFLMKLRKVRIKRKGRQ